MRPLRECTFYGLRDVNLVRPLFGANRIAMQRIDNRIMVLLILLIARWQEDDCVSIDSVAFEIAFKSRAVNLDVLHRDGLCAGNHFGNDRLHLGQMCIRDRAV